VRVKIGGGLISALFSGRGELWAKSCASPCGNSLERSEQTDGTFERTPLDEPKKLRPNSRTATLWVPRHSATKSALVDATTRAQNGCGKCVLRADMRRLSQPSCSDDDDITACTSAAATPVNLADPIEKANQAFVAGDYQGALDLWTSALSSGELRTGVLAQLGCTQSAQRAPWIPSVCCLPLTACRLPRTSPPVLQSATSTIMLCTPTAELRWSAWDRSRRRSRCAQLAAALLVAVVLVF